MSRGTVVKCWLLLCCVTVSRQLSITELEVPGCVKAGEDAELKCRFEVGNESREQLVVKWWSILAHGDKRITLYQRMDGEEPSFLPHVGLKLGELDTIVLKGVTPLDSGTYECEVSNIAGVTNTAEVRKHQDLVVFSSGSGPHLNVSLIGDAGDHVRIECEASDVAPAPDLIVKLNGIEGIVSKIISGPDERGLFSVFGNATASRAEAEGAAVTCELLFESLAVAHPPYLDTVFYASGGAASTAPPEDSTEVEGSTTETVQLEGTGHGWHPGAPWLLLVATPALAAALR